MSNNMQKTKHATAEKMQRVYGTEVEHKHNKDHLEFEDKQQSHPHQKHGGKNEGHKHLINHHADGHHDKHHHDKSTAIKSLLVCTIKRAASNC
ncbi:zinc ABC transporter [Vibrio ishigakensis]|uniref:Zinc ABC transporter n=1 Tax=Vibrio ishigakensis TaxID=1481914 RepID=A0A0B8QCX1_9VIBR|nr:zinc ABC transporter [Vibrio ishigakensis]